MWVAYPLTLSHTQGSASTSSWRYNPDLDNSYQVHIVDKSYSTNYSNDTYARGHQCPNADRVCDETMNLQTYYATNQTPQIQNKFNSGIWSKLESDIRGLTSADTIYVVTGPCYQKAGGSETINYLTAASASVTPASLPIPNYYWKALLKVKWDGTGKKVQSAQAIGIWLPHTTYESSDYSTYVVSVDTIESFIGYDLFANLPDAIESDAETNTSWSTFTAF